MNPSRSAAAVDALWALDGAGSQPAGRGDAEPGRRRGAEPRWQRRRADRPGGPWCSGARCAVAHLNLTGPVPVGCRERAANGTAVQLCSGTPLSHSTALGPGALLDR